MGQVSARKRGEYWQYRFEGAPIDGKRKQYSKSGFRTKKDALDAGAKAMAEYNESGIKFSPSTVSVADYLDYWFENQVKVNYRLTTQYSFSLVIRNYLKPGLGMYRLNALTPAACQNFVNGLADKGLAHATVKDIMGCLSAALRYAVLPCEFIQSSPLVYVRSPKHLRAARERVVISQEDFEKILKLFPYRNRYHVMVQIGWHTGMRISEVCALTWDDVDFENCTITVNKQLSGRPSDVFSREEEHPVLRGGKYNRTSWYFAPAKTVKSNRTIKFGDTLKEALLRVKAQQESDEEYYGEYYTLHYELPETDSHGRTRIRVMPAFKGLQSPLKRLRMVCVDDNGFLTTPNSFRYASRQIKNKLGIVFEFHAMRHTHATRLLEAGANVKAVQSRLGHSKVETTLQTYTHATSTMENEAVDLFEKGMEE